MEATTIPLESHTILSTSDVDIAQSAISHELTDAHITKVQDQNKFHIQINGLSLGNTQLEYVSYANAMDVECGTTSGAHFLLLGTGGSSYTTINGERALIDSQGAMVSDGCDLSHHRSSNSGEFVLKISSQDLETRLQAVLDQPVGRPVRFDRQFDTSKGIGAQVKSGLQYIADSISRDDTLLANPLLKANCDDMLLNLMLSLPSNYSDALAANSNHSGAPALVREAEAFILASIDQPINIADITAHCKCSKALLFNNFRKYRGYTPLQFLTDARLKLAHRLLTAASAADSVTSIAYDCGFLHLGRFSMAYNKRFGELPSTTLKNSQFKYL